jgi:hypothetical protein
VSLDAWDWWTDDTTENDEGAALYDEAQKRALADGYTDEPFRTSYARALMTEAGWELHPRTGWYRCY